jgi:mannose-6-phosphate isomerase-like protein (cupin superfamily)
MDFRPFWEEKCWGKVYHIFSNPHAAVSVLEVEEGFQCSIHKHEERANQFTVQEGMIQVEIWDGDNTDTCGTSLYYLRPGSTLVVPSGKWHRFVVMESGRLVEVYWPDEGGVCSMDDIIRRDLGGPSSLNLSGDDDVVEGQDIG